MKLALGLSIGDRRRLGAVAPTIAFVGANSTDGYTATYSLALDELSGGIASAPIEDDLVVLITGKCEGSGGSGGSNTIGISTSGYNTIYASGVINDVRDANIIGAYKFMGSTPDTEVVVSRQATVNQGGFAAVMVFRGVSKTNPLDVAAATASSTNTPVVTFPQIIPTTNGCMIVAGGMSTLAANDAVGHTRPSSGIIHDEYVLSTVTGGSTGGGLICCVLQNEAAAYTPPKYDKAANTSDAFAAFTVALRPKT